MSNITSDELNYLGTFDTIDEVYAVYPSGGVPGNFVVVGGIALYWDEDQMRWTQQGGSTMDDTTVNGTLTANQVIVKDGWRTSDYQEDVRGSALRKKNGQWVLSVDDIKVANDERFRGQSSFRMQVFTRSDSMPTKPSGGQYSDPQPNGMVWQEGVPQGSMPIWMSSRIYTSDGQPPQSDWSDPLMLVDSEDFDVEFSPHTLDSVPADPSPSNKGTLWFDPKEHPDANWKAMNWMATRTKSVNIHGVAEWNSWVILPTKGAKGADGDGFENVFYLTSLKKAPMPTVTTDDEIYQMPNYCPAVSNKAQCGGASNSFTASPRGVSETYPYEWVMQRRKQNGIWMPFSLPAVIFATYSREHTISISDDGFWIIDGIKTDKRAIGENGNSVTVKGRVDVYADADKESNDQTSLQSYPASLGDLEIGDSWIVKSGEDADENDISGHLFLYVGGSHQDWEDDWQDLGEFKGEKGDTGEDGHSQYLYIAWAQVITFAGNPQVYDSCDGYTTNPAEGQSYPWMGIMVSETEILDISDDRHAPNFKWNYMPGRDGTDFENVYIRTKTLDAPEISANETLKPNYQSPEFCPDVSNIEDYVYTSGDDANNTIEYDTFTDDPNGISEDWPYEWQSRREKIGGVWQAFQSPAVLHRNWGEKGDKGADGAGQAYIRLDLNQVVIDCDSNGHPIAGQGPFEINAKLYFGDEQCSITSAASSVTVDCTGFGMGQCPYQTNINANRAYIKLTMNTSAVIASGKITFSLIGEDESDVPHTATITVPIFANIAGAKGDAGNTGPVLRFRGVYSSDVDESGEGYVWDSTFRDCVRGTGGYYLVNITTNGGIELGTPSSSNDNWLNVGNLKFFATELLIAENATINLLSSNELVFYDANGHKTATINEDGEGSHVTYYTTPPYGKRKDDNADGWTYYYNNDEDNTLAWKLGPSGDIEKVSQPHWSLIQLASMGSTRPTNNSFQGSDTYNLQDYPQYFAGTSGSGLPAYDQKVFARGTTASGSPVGKTTIDGYFTAMGQPMADVSSMDSTGWTLTVHHFEDGEITETFNITTNES